MTASDTAATTPARKPGLLRRAGANPRAALGLLLLAVLVLGALIGPLVSPYDPVKPDFLVTLQAPNAAHPFGTDDLGRDIFSRILSGARVALLVGCVSVGSSIIFGTMIGLLAGFYGGWVGMVLMRVMDVLFAFPAVLLALGITAALGPSLTNAMLAISIVYLPIFARLARAQTLVVREQTFTEADRAMGFSDLSIMLRAILPNIMAPLIVQASLLFGDAIIVESYLSFLGLGTQPPQPSWGAMLKNAIGFLSLAPWMAWFPGLAIFVAVLGLNLVGDALRDRLDPRLRKSL
ncbi:peptide ABC transporter permease [Meridianimarinicoccus roseus]|jgi:peptide/nickel transport system permease protein|uniref:Peptide ABC transporter permease n=1 Tax=Meridianimarinicoccus roseus TaxID=2072018 RepID=A0A2V2LJS9_9RHOB|nr:ABC transporter permease [Meridianimarinicoccus roseus]PWR02093.1 peptide ABC transporter permease [Meridianimarinicoccus roseus]